MAAGFTAIRSNPLAFLEQVRLRYGDLVAFPVPGSPALLVSDPEAVRGILQGNARRWTKNTVQYAALATVTGPGLLAVSDDRWLRRRRAAQPAFHHGRLGTIGDSVATAAATVVGSWRGMPASGTDIDVDALALGITLDVVGRTLFDRDLTEQTAAAGPRDRRGGRARGGPGADRAAARPGCRPPPTGGCAPR